ncbi:MAG: RluA family pseudouridine synthase [Maricaulaceae bacterium]
MSPKTSDKHVLPPRRDFIYNPPTDPLDILHEDEHLIVVNKPSDLLSVPGKTEPDCLEARLQDYNPKVLTIHRLDMATSGVMVFAKTAHAQRHIGMQFEKRQTEKTYIARVAGHVENESGTIDLPLICDWPNRPRQMVCHERGKPAQTAWEVLEREAAHTRLALYPKTGRSHQLRVHCLSLGHPILGDRFYANDEILKAANRLQLHAEALKLRHPDGGEWHTFTAECPF